MNNTIHMGQRPYELLKGKNLALYPDEDLRQHALNCVAVESRRRIPAREGEGQPENRCDHRLIDGVCGGAGANCLTCR